MQSRETPRRFIHQSHVRCPNFQTAKYTITTVMTIPAGAIEDEIHQLIHFQIETFIQPAPLNYSQLQEHHRRSEMIRSLGKELDRIGTLRVVERFRKAS
jgi:hypothetical protein